MSQTCIIKLPFLCPLSSASLTHPALPLCFLHPSALLGHTAAVSLSLLPNPSSVFFACVPCPSTPLLSIKHTPHSFVPRFPTLCSVLLPHALYPHCGRGVERRYTWEAHLGYSCAAVIVKCMCGRISVSVCFHIRMSMFLCVCVWVISCAAVIWGSFTTSNLLCVVLKLLSAASLCSSLLTSILVGVFRWLAVAWPFLTAAVQRVLEESLHPRVVKGCMYGFVWRLWQRFACQSIPSTGLCSCIHERETEVLSFFCNLLGRVRGGILVLEENRSKLYYLIKTGHTYLRL